MASIINCSFNCFVDIPFTFFQKKGKLFRLSFTRKSITNSGSFNSDTLLSVSSSDNVEAADSRTKMGLLCQFFVGDDVTIPRTMETMVLLLSRTMETAANNNDTGDNDNGNNDNDNDNKNNNESNYKGEDDDGK